MRFIEVRITLLTGLPVPMMNLTVMFILEGRECKISCEAVETGEIYSSQDYLVDGTPCSYDEPNGICVQGKCEEIGCNHQFNSSKTISKLSKFPTSFIRSL